MEKDKNDASPFAALTYQEQQDRWLEWRSRQLAYEPVEAEKPAAPAPLSSDAEEERAPFAPAVVGRPAPSRHRELDEVLKRHAQAQKRAAHFLPVNAAPDGSAPAKADEVDTPHN